MPAMNDVVFKLTERVKYGFYLTDGEIHLTELRLIIDGEVVADSAHPKELANPEETINRWLDDAQRTAEIAFQKVADRVDVIDTAITALGGDSA